MRCDAGHSPRLGSVVKVLLDETTTIRPREDASEVGRERKRPTVEKKEIPRGRASGGRPIAAPALTLPPRGEQSAAPELSAGPGAALANFAYLTRNSMWTRP